MELELEVKDLDLTENIISSLNKRQREAVLTNNSPLLILAGAGTGKTNTITKKIAYIIASGFASPSQVLAVTFTNKAANEMRERIIKVVKNGQDVNIGTFHSICLKMLRFNHSAIGVEKNFVVIDAQDQKDILKAIAKEIGICTKTYSVKNLSSIISKAKDADLDDFEKAKFVPEAMRGISLNILLSEYNKKLKALNAFDFDDLLLRTVRMLQDNKNILEYYQSKYKYIMVDEYQDTNTIQYKLIKLLTGSNSNICVVGDDDQSIYGWRGADIENILRFSKEFKGAKTIRLEDNYRSTPSILNVANSLINNNSNRLGKNLVSTKKHDKPVVIRQHIDERNEVTFIINQIMHINQINGVPLSQIAILLRSSALSRYLEESLIKSNIAYKIIGGLRFYERKEVKDVISYLRILGNDMDFISFKRAMSNPKRGIGDASLDKIESFATQNNLGITETLKIISEDGFFSGTNLNLRLVSKAREAINDFYIKLQRWQSIINTENLRLDFVAEEIMSDISYEEFLRSESEDTREFEAKSENLRELSRLLSDFRSIGDFLEYSSLSSDETGLSKNGQETKESLSIMTIHASKGLEFEAVFVPFLEDGIFPNQRAIDESKTGDVEEERRLGYVAVTRAMRYLYLTFSKHRFFAGSLVPTTRSRFIDEITAVQTDSFEFLKQEFSPLFNQKKSKSSYEEDDTTKPKSKNSGYSPNPKRAVRLNQGFAKNLSIGTPVSHKIFGTGKVQKIDGLFYEVIFDNDSQKRSIRKDFLESI